MKVHLAVWDFAEKEGTKQARADSAIRKMLKGKTQAESDSRVLRGRGGHRLRKSWLKLTKSAQNELMDRTPDDSVPGAIDGILNERCTGSKMAPKGGTRPLEIYESHSRVMETIDEVRDTIQDGHNLQETELRNPSRAKARYYDIKCREELLRLNTAYNLGNLTLSQLPYQASTARYISPAPEIDPAQVTKLYCSEFSPHRRVRQRYSHDYVSTRS
ncbi:hypothetical protein JG688_00016583 [Phytophthora aleatoria]|uniref:Uncharacterized protein n=1 Tax=Phytophthora aleatoria TaxID=2496075 RepID=A0A8J5LYY0_9STRA|nr:hypothetical protein JG688_00016583 [Phytophthora aleatoria]